MSFTSKVHHITLLLVDVFGLKIKDEIVIEKRIRQVTAVAIIGIVFGLVFALFNLFTPNMFSLGLIEFGVVVFCMLPAAILGRKAQFVSSAETLVLLAMLIIVSALIVYGGIEGTGLFWVYTAPFLAFFLKGQRLGWWYSFTLGVLISTYFLGLNRLLPFAYQFTPVVMIQFIISVVFYSLIAAAFNHLRSRFEEQLQKQVLIKTLDATELLNQLQFNATHNPETRLPNRLMLVDLVQNQLAEIHTDEHILVVCDMRLERLFEMANIVGSAGSADLTIKISRHLEQLVRDKGALAHTSHDEFIVAYHTTRTQFNQEGLQRLIAERQISIEVQGYQLYCEFTMGMAIYPDHAQEPVDLINKAERAMLQAKTNGLQWAIFDPQSEQAFVRHHLLFGKLREAISQQHLRVHYQPQIDLQSGKVIGAEALLRWNDPFEGFISPLEFIPVAEESGLIRPLTAWLIDTCARECAAWQHLDIHITVSINLSALNLIDPELQATLQAAVYKYNLAAKNLSLEITESCFSHSPERTLETITRLHDNGFMLSIDDFGTGSSSLSYLKKLPLKELKIDQSFVRKLLQNTSDQAIAAATINLAHNFGLIVVAEGIEDEPTSQWLRAQGCDIGQGYFFAKPMASEAFVQFALLNLLNQRHPDG